MIAIGTSGLVATCLVQVLIDGLAVFDTTPWRPDGRAILHTSTIGASVGLALVGVRSIRRPAAPEPDPLPWLPGVAMALAVVPLVVVWFSPLAFDVMSREDRPVELVSAASNLVTAGALIVVARRWTRPRAAPVLAMAGAALFAFITLEEVSWFQRIVGFGTPSAFEANDQGEVNLHNFATDAFQNLYYLGAVVVLVLVPFVAACAGAAWPPRARALVPQAGAQTLAVASVPYNYTETTYPASHVAWWITVVALTLWPDGPARMWRLALIAYVVLAQAQMFVVGPDLPRHWAPSEYRELFTASAFAVAATQVAVAAKRSDEGIAVRS